MLVYVCIFVFVRSHWRMYASSDSTASGYNLSFEDNITGIRYSKPPQSTQFWAILHCSLNIHSDYLLLMLLSDISTYICMHVCNDHWASARIAFTYCGFTRSLMLVYCCVVFSEFISERLLLFHISYSLLWCFKHFLCVIISVRSVIILD